MAKINRYTQTVIAPRQTPQMVDQGAVMDAGTGFQAVAQLTDQASQQIQAAEVKKQTRYETIQRARAVSAYQQELQQEYTKFASENDLTDPKSSMAFSTQIKNKMQEYLAKHEGGADSRASLELQLTALKDNMSMKAIDDATAAQDSLISEQMGSHLARISKETYDNPASIMENGAKQVNGLLIEYGGALDGMDENKLRKSMMGDIAMSALDSYIDRGDFESADALFSELDVVDNIPVDKQRAYLGKINAGTNAKNKRLVETNQRKEEIQEIEKSGVQVSPESKLKFIYGNEIEMTLESKMKLLKAENKTLTDDQALALADPQMYTAYEKARGDPNKERLPDGRLSASGLSKAIAEEIKPLYTMQSKMIGLQASVEQFRLGNKAAALSAITTWKQTFEPNSAVMEGEVRLQQEADSLTGIIEKLTTPGQAVSSQQIEEMYSVAQSFLKLYANKIKGDVDFYLKRGEEQGLSGGDLYLSNDKYLNMFGTAERGKVKTIKDMSTEELLKSVEGQ